jgi:hypothetical protein
MRWVRRVICEGLRVMLPTPLAKPLPWRTSRPTNSVRLPTRSGLRGTLRRKVRRTKPVGLNAPGNGRDYRIRSARSYSTTSACEITSAGTYATSEHWSERKRGGLDIGCRASLSCVIRDGDQCMADWAEASASPGSAFFVERSPKIAMSRTTTAIPAAVRKPRCMPSTIALS